MEEQPVVTEQPISETERRLRTELRLKETAQYSFLTGFATGALVVGAAIALGLHFGRSQ